MGEWVCEVGGVEDGCGRWEVGDVCESCDGR